jgi:hypothetical protein
MRTSPALVSLGLVLTLTARAAAPATFSPFAGRWTGTLEYRDYGGSGKHISIPVKLQVRSTAADSAVWDFRYDDFGHEVQSLETHTWKSGRYTVTTRGKPDVQSYTSSDFAAFAAGGTGTAVLSGQELENGQKVEVRRTIRLEGTKLITLTETRLAGKVFTFRNQSVYARLPQ